MEGHRMATDLSVMEVADCSRYCPLHRLRAVRFKALLAVIVAQLLRRMNELLYRAMWNAIRTVRSALHS